VFSMDLAVSEVRVGDRRMFTGIVRDITDRKRSEEEQQKLVSLVENSSDLIMMCSLDGGVRYLNRAGREMTGVDSPEQVLGTTIGDYMPEEEWARVREVELPMVLKNGNAEWQGEVRHIRSGRRIAMQVDFFLIRHPKTGEPMCLGSIPAGYHGSQAGGGSTQEEYVGTRAVQPAGGRPRTADDRAEEAGERDGQGGRTGLSCTIWRLPRRRGGKANRQGPW